MLHAHHAKAHVFHTIWIQFFHNILHIVIFQTVEIMNEYTYEAIQQHHHVVDSYVCMCVLHALGVALHTFFPPFIYQNLVCLLTFPIISFYNSVNSSNLYLFLFFCFTFLSVDLKVLSSKSLRFAFYDCSECLCFTFSCLYLVHFCFLLSFFSSVIGFQENPHHQGIGLVQT